MMRRVDMLSEIIESLYRERMIPNPHNADEPPRWRKFFGFMRRPRPHPMRNGTRRRANQGRVDMQWEAELFRKKHLHRHLPLRCRMPDIVKPPTNDIIMIEPLHHGPLLLQICH